MRLHSELRILRKKNKKCNKNLRVSTTLQLSISSCHWTLIVLCIESNAIIRWKVISLSYCTWWWNKVAVIVILHSNGWGCPTATPQTINNIIQISIRDNRLPLLDNRKYFSRQGHYATRTQFKHVSSAKQFYNRYEVYALCGTRIRKTRRVSRTDDGSAQCLFIYLFRCLRMAQSRGPLDIAHK
jgi:hypothetical protein